MSAGLSAGRPDAEARLAGQYVGVLALVWRCAQVLERGDLFALCEHTTYLEPAAERLAETAGRAFAAWDADPGAVRPEQVRKTVAHQRHASPAVALLHPAELAVGAPLVEDVRRAWAAYEAAEDAQAAPGHQHGPVCTAADWIPDLVADVEQLAAALHGARLELQAARQVVWRARDVGREDLDDTDVAERLTDALDAYDRIAARAQGGAGR
jgi:hypothetical protein